MLVALMCACTCGLFFFFKQKTAYEMRISDWSSDVCSSDLVTPYLRRSVAAELGIKPYEVWRTIESATAFKRRLRRCLFVGLSDGSRIDEIGRASCRERVCPYV